MLPGLLLRSATTTTDFRWTNSLLKENGIYQSSEESTCGNPETSFTASCTSIIYAVFVWGPPLCHDLQSIQAVEIASV